MLNVVGKIAYWFFLFSRRGCKWTFTQVIIPFIGKALGLVMVEWKSYSYDCSLELKQKSIKTGSFKKWILSFLKVPLQFIEYLMCVNRKKNNLICFFLLKKILLMNFHTRYYLLYSEGNQNIHGRLEIIWFCLIIEIKAENNENTEFFLKCKLGSLIPLNIFKHLRCIKNNNKTQFFII